MKKIVSAVAIAAVAASVATAEVKTSINFRMGTNVFNNPNTSSDKVTYFDLGDVTGTDAFTFKASNDWAGITLNYNPNSAGTSIDPTKKDVTVSEKDGEFTASYTNTYSSAKAFWLSGAGCEYTGYVRPAEWLELKAGVHKDGIFYAEQVKKDTDDTAWSAAGKYAYLYKYGPTTKNSTAYAIDDLTSYQIGGTPFFFADFKLADIGGGNMLVRASVADTGKNWLLTGNYSNKTVPTPGLMVAWKNETVNINLDAQSISNNDLAAGLFVSPLGLADNALQLTVGASLSTVFDGEDKAVGKTQQGDGVTFYAVDLGVRYVAGDFHIANRFNYTGATEDQMVKQGASTATARTGNANIWDSVFVTYKLNDAWMITGNIQLQAATGVKVGDDDNAVIDLSVTPGLMYTVGKGATITAGLYTTFNDMTGKASKDADMTIGVALPVITRIKL